MVQFFFSVFVFSSKKKEKLGITKIDSTFFSETKITRSTHPRYYCYTETGKSNYIVHSQIMRIFIEKFKLEYPNIYYFVFSNQLSFHKNINIILECYWYNIFIWFFPSNY